MEPSSRGAIGVVWVAMLQELIRIAWVGLNKRTNTVDVKMEVSIYRIDLSRLTFFTNY